MAKAIPHTKAGSHVSRNPRHPSMMITNNSGTNSANTGVCRPTTDDTTCNGSPVTCANVITGVPIAPNATGAVLATSDTAAALSGENPSATSITEQMATGAPNPASASISAPKQ